MPIVYIEKDVLELMIDCLIECGHEEKILDIIDMTNDLESCSDDDEKNIIIKEEAVPATSIVEDKTKALQLKRGRVLDTE